MTVPRLLKRLAIAMGLTYTGIGIYHLLYVSAVAGPSGKYRSRGSGDSRIGTIDVV
jgi:hypothetical protein